MTLEGWGFDPWLRTKEKKKKINMKFREESKQENHVFGQLKS